MQYTNQELKHYIKPLFHSEPYINAPSCKEQLHITRLHIATLTYSRLPAILQEWLDPTCYKNKRDLRSMVDIINWLCSIK